MIVKDLPKTTNVSTVKIRIPDDEFTTAPRNLKTQEVYVTSMWAHGIWVKTDLMSDNVYPLQVNPQRVLNWQVVSH